MFLVQNIYIQKKITPNIAYSALFSSEKLALDEIERQVADAMVNRYCDYPVESGDVNREINAVHISGLDFLDSWYFTDFSTVEKHIEE